MKRATILVTHLYGSGHLSRALTLARAFIDAGIQTQILSGGMPVGHFQTAGLDFVQLPPVRAIGSSFSSLVDEPGNPIGPPLLGARGRVIAEALRAFQPDAIVTELFPFGRRLLRQEFETALDVAKTLPKPPVVVSSLRDVPAPPSAPYKAVECEAWLNKYYSAVLVHSDPKVIRLEMNWPVTPGVEKFVRYTGFVMPPLPSTDTGNDDGRDEILITAGGGPTGRRLFEISIEASRAKPGRRWRLLVGGVDADAVIARMREQARGTEAIIERTRKDYRQMLIRAAAAVGQCGYNTAMDWLQTGVSGVFVPFTEDGETEQLFRAQILADRYGFGCMAEEELTPENLNAAVDAAVARGRVPITDLKFHGAEESARIVAELADARG